MKALRAAFPYTIPILTGFLFLGASYGMYAVDTGLPFWFPILTSVTVFGGSLEFVLVSLLTGAFDPAGAALMALMIQARHLFYGLAMLERYRDAGRVKPYLIFGLCDETFSINCAVTPPEGVSRARFYFCVTLLDQLYWISGCALGALLGSALALNTRGIDFVMTAMFVVIFLDHWQKHPQHAPALIGLGAAALCLLLFGPSSFLIPAMLGILGLLLAFRGRIEKDGDDA